MRLVLAAALIGLAGCASDPVEVAGGIRRGEAAAGPRRVAAGAIPVLEGPATRRHVVLEDVTGTARQITVFGRVPTREDAANELRKRAAELNADAVVNARYGEKGVGVVSWAQISATGQAVRYSD